MRLNKKMSCILAAVLTASLAVPGGALAEENTPKEELEELLEQVQESRSNTLLNRDLAWEALADAIEDNGILLQLDLGMTDGTLKTMGMEGEIPADGRVSLGVTVDQNQKKWQVDADVQANGESFVDLSIYADQDLLSLTSSKLYSGGAAAIRSGSFREQFDGSALKTIMEIEDEIPDFNLKFFPEKEDFEALQLDYYAELQDDMLEVVEDSTRVEKSEDGDQILYTAYIQTETVMDAYQNLVDEYLDLLLSLGAVSYYEAEDFDSELDTVLRQMKLLLGDEIPVEYYVENGVLQSILFEMEVDPSVLEGETEYAAAEPETWAAEMEESPVDLEVDLEVSDEGGVVSFEIVFTDPASPYRSFESAVIAEDLEGNELMSMYYEVSAETTETTERTECRVAVYEAEEEIYSGTVMWSEYNSETGKLDAAIELDDGYDTVVCRLDSTVKAEKGKYISWEIAEAIMECDGESIGLEGSILISSEPEAIQAPENPKMILEMEQGPLMGLLAEVAYNLEALAAEPEYEEVYVSEPTYESPVTEIAVETETETETEMTVVEEATEATAEDTTEAVTEVVEAESDTEDVTEADTEEAETDTEDATEADTEEAETDTEEVTEEAAENVTVGEAA